MVPVFFVSVQRVLARDREPKAAVVSETHMPAVVTREGG